MGTADEEKDDVLVKEDRNTEKRMYAYGNTTPLTVAGLLEANVTIGTKTVNAEFVVIEEHGQPLLGKQMYEDLGINIDEVRVVNTSVTKEKIKAIFPTIFSGPRKAINYQLSIPIGSSVNSSVQPLRRIPYGRLREKLDLKIDGLEQLNIIEKVAKPCKLVSLLKL